MFVLWKVIASLIVVVALTIGFIDILINVESNGCEMTYMYENPQYHKVPLSSKVSSKYPRYNLYVYGEGYYADSLRRLNMHGIPVLFIHGNAGSYKQVRSLASVALRKAENMAFHFNYFSVDLNEEFSGMMGGTLQQQTEYVHYCIKKILSLYKKARNPPSSVVLVGHSMGGVIARALFSLPQFAAHHVHLIITQATPHQQPVVSLDEYLVNFYKKVNHYWAENSDTVLANVTIVSTGGGERDYQVPTWSTSLSNIANDDVSISAATTAVPFAWVSTDHLCAVWCRQIVLITNRALFDLVDRTTNQISNNLDFKKRVLQTHFLEHPGKTRPMRSWKTSIDIDPEAPWILQEKSSWNYHQKQVSKVKYLVSPIPEHGDMELDHFTAVSDVLADSWICACTLPQGQKHCSNCTNLSQKGRSLLPKKSYKKYVILKLSELSDYTHIILIVAANSPMSAISAEFYSSNRRHLLSPLPSWFNLPFSFSHNALYYQMKFYKMDSVLKAYTFSLQPYNCQSRSNDEYAGSVIAYKLPWANVANYKFIEKNSAGNLSFKLLVPKPYKSRYSDPELQLFLNPYCNYRLLVEWSLIMSLGQFVRFYGWLIPAFCVSQLMLAMILQLMRKRTDCHTLMETMWAQKINWVLVLPLVAIGESVLRHFKFFNGYLPHYDGMALTERGVWGSTVPLMLAAITFAIVYIHASIITLIHRILCTIFSEIIPESNLLVGVCRLLTILVLVLATVLAYAVCGTMSLFLCYVVYFFKVISIGITAQRSHSSEDLLNLTIHQTIFIFWQWLLLLNLPSFLAWNQQQTYSLHLSPDPSQVIGLIAPVCTAVFFFCDKFVLMGRLSRAFVSLVLYSCVILSLLYGIENIFCLPVFIMSALSFLGCFNLLNSLLRIGQQKPKSL